MPEWAPYLIGAIPATVVGILAYLSTKRRDKGDDRSKLIDDALQLAETHKKEWSEVRTEIRIVRAELSEATSEALALREAVKACRTEVEKWKGVAVAVAQEHKQATGAVPLAWPRGEPLPAAGGA